MIEVDLDEVYGLHGSSYGGWLWGQNRNVSSVLSLLSASVRKSPGTV